MPYFKTPASSSWCPIFRDSCRKGCIFTKANPDNPEGWLCKLEAAVDVISTIHGTLQFTAEPFSPIWQDGIVTHTEDKPPKKVK